MIDKVGIVGSGTMGSGIAQVASTVDCQVKLYDSNPEALERSRQKLGKILDRQIEKGRMAISDKDRIVGNITYVSQLKDLSDSNLIIEAIVEDLDVKKELMRKLEKLTSKKAILATNTSSLSVTSIAAALKRPTRCVGIHFFNPAPLMKLVEVVPALQTSEKILNRTIENIEHWGKTVSVAKDTPGFIVNRVARPFYGEALRIYEEGIADFVTIDWAMKSIGGFRMGPFELMDYIGNDVNYVVTKTVFKAFYNDPRYKPSFTQKRLSEAGYLGRKSGRGYYDYSDKAIRPEPHQNVGLAQKIVDRILVMLINEAADALFWNIASAEDIDNAMTLGVNYPKGLLAWADEKGMEWCVSKMDELHAEYLEDRYRCSPLLRRNLREENTFFTQ